LQAGGQQIAQGRSSPADVILIRGVFGDEGLKEVAAAAEIRHFEN
jgi:hypothetical protein